METCTSRLPGPHEPIGTGSVLVSASGSSADLAGPTTLDRIRYGSDGGTLIRFSPLRTVTFWQLWYDTARPASRSAIVPPVSLVRIGYPSTASVGPSPHSDLSWNAGGCPSGLTPGITTSVICSCDDDCGVNRSVIFLALTAGNAIHPSAPAQPPRTCPFAIIDTWTGGPPSPPAPAWICSRSIRTRCPNLIVSDGLGSQDDGIHTVRGSPSTAERPSSCGWSSIVDEAVACG